MNKLALRFYLLYAVFFLTVDNLFAQFENNTPSIKGVVIDAESNEPLVGASIVLTESNKGVIGNSVGISLKIFNLFFSAAYVFC